MTLTKMILKIDGISRSLGNEKTMNYYRIRFLQLYNLSIIHYNEIWWFTIYHDFNNIIIGHRRNIIVLNSIDSINNDKICDTYVHWLRMR